MGYFNADWLSGQAVRQDWVTFVDVNKVSLHIIYAQNINYRR